MLIDADWRWLKLIGADWCWLMLIDADWCWLMLTDADWCSNKVQPGFLLSKRTSGASPVIFDSGLDLVYNISFQQKTLHFKKTWCQIQSSADLKVSAFGKGDGTSQISGKPILSVIQGGWLLFEYFATRLNCEEMAFSHLGTWVHSDLICHL